MNQFVTEPVAQIQASFKKHLIPAALIQNHSPVSNPELLDKTQ